MPKVNKTDNITDVDSLENENNTIEILKKENEDLKNQIEKIMSMLETKTKNNDSIIECEDEDLKEPLPTKNIRIISLYYGSLNLSDGHGTKLSFGKYGEIKNCLYSKLVDIVNNDLKFAQAGMFYIADKNAVYHLGLADYYKKIQPKEILDNICTYDDNFISSVGKTLTKEQKETLSFGIAKRMFDGENFDLNKINVLSKAIGINIINKLEEMKELDRINSKSSS